MADIVQGTELWFKQRLGKVTASRMGDMTAKTKAGYGASRANYKAEKLIERLTGAQQDTYKSPSMQWGNDQEPYAREAYSFYTNNEVVETGFVVHPLIENAGASPDGLIGDDGMLEIKCPNTSTMLEYLETEKIPANYMKQIQWQLACCDRHWCDFAAYDPRLPEEMRLLVIRVERNNDMIAELEQETLKFLAELDETEALLRKKYMKG